MTADDVPVYRARSRHFNSNRPKSRHGEGGHEELLFKTLATLREIAAEAGIPLSDLAIAWPLHVEGVCTVIAGATKVSQIESNARAAGITIPPDVLKKLTDATEELKQVGWSLWLGPGVFQYLRVCCGWCVCVCVFFCMMCMYALASFFYQLVLLSFLHMCVLCEGGGGDY